MSIKHSENYYEILELPRTCSQEEISESYSRLSLKYHPKVNLKKLKREELSFFFDKKLKNEQEILRNKFDNCSNI